MTERPTSLGTQNYLALLESMRILHLNKNAGYAGSDNPDAWANFRRAEEFGVEAWRGTLVRLSDKYARIVSLMRNADHEQVGESFEDTLMDLAAYALITICLRKEFYEQQPPYLQDHRPVGRDRQRDR